MCASFPSRPQQQECTGTVLALAPCRHSRAVRSSCHASTVSPNFIPRPPPGSSEWKWILKTLVGKFEPEKMAHIDGHLAHYANAEGHLYDFLCAKHCPEDMVHLGFVVKQPVVAPVATSLPVSRSNGQNEDDSQSNTRVGMLPPPPPAPPRAPDAQRKRKEPPTVWNPPGTKRTICIGYQGRTVQEVSCDGAVWKWDCTVTGNPKYPQKQLHVCVGCRYYHDVPRTPDCIWKWQA